MGEKKQIFDEWSDKYEKWFKTPLGQIVRETELNLLMESLNPQAGETILDAGCGTGIFTTDFLAKGPENRGHGYFAKNASSRQSQDRGETTFCRLRAISSTFPFWMTISTRLSPIPPSNSSPTEEKPSANFSASSSREELWSSPPSTASPPGPKSVPTAPGAVKPTSMTKPTSALRKSCWHWRRSRANSRPWCIFSRMKTLKKPK